MSESWRRKICSGLMPSRTPQRISFSDLFHRLSHLPHQADLPGRLPYLAVDPARLKRWRKRLKPLPRPLVGLVWAGRPTHLNYSNRSVGLDTLSPLAMPGITFLALQKGAGRNPSGTATGGHEDRTPGRRNRRFRRHRRNPDPDGSPDLGRQRASSPGRRARPASLGDAALLTCRTGAGC